MARAGWDEYFLHMAEFIATRSTCPTKQVGAIFVEPTSKFVLSMGYNGSPRGTKHCGKQCASRKHGENTSACRAVHAEANAIFSAAYNGVGLRGSDVYCTLGPCQDCAQAIIQVGAKRVVFLNDSAYPEVLQLLEEAGIIVEKFGGMVESADTADLKSAAFGHGGSSPSTPTGEEYDIFSRYFH